MALQKAKNLPLGRGSAATACLLSGAALVPERQGLGFVGHDQTEAGRQPALECIGRQPARAG